MPLLFPSPVGELLGKAEVSQSYVALTVQQNVLWLQVPVDDFFGVKVFNGAYNLRGVEEPCGIAEAPTAAQIAEQLTTWHIVHQHVQKSLIMVGPKPKI